jgi:hypothetical protein
MGELLDALNAADASIPPKARFDRSTTDNTAETQSASRHVVGAIETGRRPGMLLDILAKLVRQAPLHSLAITFLLGATIFRRR